VRRFSCRGNVTVATTTFILFMLAVALVVVGVVSSELGHTEKLTELLVGSDHGGKRL